MFLLLHIKSSLIFHPLVRYLHIVPRWHILCKERHPQSVHIRAVSAPQALQNSVVFPSLPPWDKAVPANCSQCLVEQERRICRRKHFFLSQCVCRTLGIIPTDCLLLIQLTIFFSFCSWYVCLLWLSKYANCLVFSEDVAKCGAYIAPVLTCQRS